ncbi:hypothetical protein BUALT_Bualt18G0109400 [Buddleja alternifolia]|uniref:Fiber protein Fb34 n=1 Tax=Buddleja alternifolia TaxID=168488 RepID=A0AAV6WEZ5_9LAMI|nr:hypothetical protein BUALT_Bualt18G0109400 [Buddleja alternifolia]
MAYPSKLVFVVVFIFDLIAFALAVAAEQRRSSARLAIDADSNYCVYDSDAATGLGIGSFLLLMVSQVLIMAASRCLCCGRALRPGGSRLWAIFFFVTCWVTFFIAELCLIAGSLRNGYHTKYRTYFTRHPPSCETLRKGVFGAGAAFIVFTGIASELFYATYLKTDHHGFLPQVSRDNVGIRMGSI